MFITSIVLYSLTSSPPAEIAQACRPHPGSGRQNALAGNSAPQRFCGGKITTKKRHGETQAMPECLCRPAAPPASSLHEDLPVHPSPHGESTKTENRPTGRQNASEMAETLTPPKTGKDKPADSGGHRPAPQAPQRGSGEGQLARAEEYPTARDEVRPLPGTGLPPRRHTAARTPTLLYPPENRLAAVPQRGFTRSLKCKVFAIGLSCSQLGDFHCEKTERPRRFLGKTQPRATGNTKCQNGSEGRLQQILSAG